MESTHYEGAQCANTITKYKCEYCCYVTDLWITLKNHVSVYHKESQNNKKFTDLVIKAYPCKNCVSTFYSLLVWYGHQRKCTYFQDDKSTDDYNESVDDVRYRMMFSEKSKICLSEPEHRGYKCNQCEFKTRAKSNLTQHIKIKHVSKENLEQYECSHCFYRTPIKSNLKSHIVCRHTDLKKIIWFDCDQCDFKAKVKCNLIRHIKIKHTSEENKYKCSQCFYKTAYKAHLQNHILTQHTDLAEIKWFECDQCEYKAKQKSNLTNHIKIKHAPKENREKYKCSQCFQNTVDEAHLKCTDCANIKLFECDQCEYKAEKESNLMRHRKNKHASEGSLKQHKCSQCFYKTIYKSALKNHILTRHTDLAKIKWFECNQCKYKAKVKKELTRHIKNKHAFKGNLK